jgi:hypothetical protein
MSQQILFKRSLTTFNSRAEAVTKFDSLTWNAGEPVIANYIDNGVTRVLFAIGIANLVGSQGYRIISDFETVGQLTTALSNLSTALGAHEDVLATGTGEDAVAGHVINSDESDIEFTNGIGKLKTGSLALESLTKNAAAGIIGYKSSDLVDGEASASIMTWNDVLGELNTAGLKIFGKIKMGKASDAEHMVEVTPSQLGATLSITTDANITVSSPGAKQLHISLNADLSEAGSELKTLENQPIVISGTTTEIVTAFNPAGVALPGGSTAATVGIGSTYDTESSTVIATVGYVSQKINSVLESNDAMHYMGTFDPTTQTLPSGNAGDTYKISVDGEIVDLGSVHVGDMIICNADNTVEGTASGWDLIEVHNGSLIAPEGATGGNLVIFGNGNEVADSGISADSLLTKNSGITAGDGLEGGGSFANGNVTISHETVTTEVVGEGSLITDIEYNERGHVTKITKGNIDDSLSLTHQGQWQESGYVAPDSFVSGITLSNGVITAFSSAMPGKVRVAEGQTLSYLKDAFGTKSDLKTNEYAISAAQNGAKVELSVVIDKIDGGTF